jgi:lysozyme
MQDKPAWLITKEWKRWVYAGGKQLPGLVKRRDWEAERFFDVACEWNKNY